MEDPPTSDSQPPPDSEPVPPPDDASPPETPPATTDKPAGGPAKPSAEPVDLSKLPPPTTPAVAPAAASGRGLQSGWYNGPWPAPGIKPVESTGSAVGRTIVMSLTALVVLFGLPLLLLLGLIFGLAGVGLATAGSQEQADSGLFREYVAGDRSGSTRLVSVPVIGGILGEDRGGGGFFATAAGVTYGYSIKDTLLELADDERVDGVLLELDTPGGTIFGSKAIADGVAEYQARTGNPVVAYVSGISASGGMYAMAGADEIIADHGTLIGSIGVIFGPFVHYNDVVATDGGLFGGGVTTEGGIDFEFLTAGRNKDLGSPYREMTPEERKILEESLDDAYGEFVTHVADGRGLAEREIVDDLGALIFGEQQALSRGLIDTIANRDEAHQRLADLAGADGDDWRLDRSVVGPPGLLDLLINGATDEAPPTGELPAMCTGTAIMLTYHGDPADLCAPLLAATVAD